MSSDAKIPEWAMEVAFEAQTAAIEECKAQRLGANYDYPFVTCRSKEVLDRHIALALLAAEQRGRKAGIEEAAEVAAAEDGNSLGGFGNPDFGPNVARRITASIRSLGDKP